MSKRITRKDLRSMIMNEVKRLSEQDFKVEPSSDARLELDGKSVSLPSSTDQKLDAGADAKGIIEKYGDEVHAHLKKTVANEPNMQLFLTIYETAPDIQKALTIYQHYYRLASNKNPEATRKALAIAKELQLR